MSGEIFGGKGYDVCNLFSSISEKKDLFIHIERTIKQMCQNVGN